MTYDSWKLATPDHDFDVPERDEREFDNEEPTIPRSRTRCEPTVTTANASQAIPGIASAACLACETQ